MVSHVCESVCVSRVGQGGRKLCDNRRRCTEMFLVALWSSKWQTLPPYLRRCLGQGYREDILTCVRLVDWTKKRTQSLLRRSLAKQYQIIYRRLVTQPHTVIICKTQSLPCSHISLVGLFRGYRSSHDCCHDTRIGVCGGIHNFYEK